MRALLKRWTRPECYVGKDWPNWYVGLGRHRGSDCLTSVNFDVFLEEIRKASDGGNVLEPGMRKEYSVGEGFIDASELINTVYVVHESHWAVGWVEWIAIHETDLGALTKAAELLLRLDDYPALDEDRWALREEDEINNYWQQQPMRYRVELCQESDECIFAARRDYPPIKVFDWLRDTLVV